VEDALKLSRDFIRLTLTQLAELGRYLPKLNNMLQRIQIAYHVADVLLRRNNDRPLLELVVHRTRVARTA